MFSQFHFCLTIKAAVLALLNALIVFCSPLVSYGAQADLKREFDQLLADWKQCAKDATVANQKFMICDSDEADGFRQKWFRAIESGRAKFDGLLPIAVGRMQSESPADPEVLGFLVLVLEMRYEVGDYDGAYDLGKTMLAVTPDAPGLLIRQAFSTFAINQFDECLNLINQIEEKIGGVPPELESVARSIQSQVEAWKQESELRAIEAKSDDLPRVELVLDVGGITRTVTIELFENEAPGTVANFISLVERGFYKDRAFFRVINHLEATAGCPDDNGNGNPGYFVRGEASSPTARKHFRGSIGMVNMNETSDEGSQFYITFAPNPDLNGRSTVFGRVLEGQSAIDRISRTHEILVAEKKLQEIPNIVPTRIESARVLRKRDHEYLPDKITK